MRKRFGDCSSLHYDSTFDGHLDPLLAPSLPLFAMSTPSSISIPTVPELARLFGVREDEPERYKSLGVGQDAPTRQLVRPPPPPSLPRRSLNARLTVLPFSYQLESPSLISGSVLVRAYPVFLSDSSSLDASSFRFRFLSNELARLSIPTTL